MRAARLEVEQTRVGAVFPSGGRLQRICIVSYQDFSGLRRRETVPRAKRRLPSRSTTERRSSRHDDVLTTSTNAHRC